MSRRRLGHPIAVPTAQLSADRVTSQELHVLAVASRLPRTEVQFAGASERIDEELLPVLEQLEGERHEDVRPRQPIRYPAGFRSIRLSVVPCTVSGHSRGALA